MDIPSVYATGVATLAMLECLNAGALAPAAVEEKLDSAINWLFLNQRQSSGLLSWKPDELAVSSSKGVTVFTSYVLLRASKQLGRIRSVMPVADLGGVAMYESVQEDGRATKDERRGVAEASRAVA
jgi:hypothetical protein